MFSKFSVFSSILLIVGASYTSLSNAQELHDEDIRHFIRTLPRMVPQLRDVDITISEAYYIWPKDAALHAKGEVLLEQYGYDALRLEALRTFCKTWFCLNYDSLLHQRQKFLMSTEEQITENPYINDDQKRINIRILNKELGHDCQQLRESVGSENLEVVKSYYEEIKEMWKKIRD